MKPARIIFFIYHIIFFSKNPSCRFQPTCSQYCLEAIEKCGFFKGSFLTLKRVLNCHPFSKRPFYDPL